MGVCSEAGLGVAVIVSRTEGKVGNEVVNLATKLAFSFYGSLFGPVDWQL
jgi:hypothetical protein